MKANSKPIEVLARISAPSKVVHAPANSHLFSCDLRLGQVQLLPIISTSYADGTGNYNAMYLQIQKRLSRGTTVLANYTWSHCISDLWNGNPGNTGQSNATPGDRRFDRGSCETAVYKARISVTCSIFPQSRRCRRSRTMFCGWS